MTVTPFPLAQAFTPGETEKNNVSLLQEAFKPFQEAAMSHVFHQLYYHFAWATHSREPLIDRTWRPHLLEVMNEEVTTRGGWPIRHNAMPDHAHLLCRLPPTVLVSDFIGQLKGATSFRVNKEIRAKFKLAGGLRRGEFAQR